jgi:hypothetical protein
MTIFHPKTSGFLVCTSWNQWRPQRYKADSKLPLNHSTPDFPGFLATPRPPLCRDGEEVLRRHIWDALWEAASCMASASAPTSGTCTAWRRCRSSGRSIGSIELIAGGSGLRGQARHRRSACNCKNQRKVDRHDLTPCAPPFLSSLGKTEPNAAFKLASPGCAREGHLNEDQPASQSGAVTPGPPS